MDAVAVVFAVTGPVGEILAGVQAFRSRFSGTRIENLSDEDGLSVREWLAHVDELLADGVITSEEHSAQRARILGEL